MASVYLYSDGIREAANKLSGNEKIHVGIRPYEMHAGNVLAIIAYPIILFEEFEKSGKIAKFELIVSLNDWEQDTLIGEDIHKYKFDIKPQHTTIQFAKELDGQLTSGVWSKKILDAINEIKYRFPLVKITPVYNSELKTNPIMKSVILKTIKSRKVLKNIMLRASGEITNGSDVYYCNALCPSCMHANTDTTLIENDTLSTNCSNCGSISKLPYSEYSFWLYHKPLFVARWKIFNFQYSISGGDHYFEGDVNVRESLYKFYFGDEIPKLNMIFSPILLGTNKQKMSKSRQNYYSADLNLILDKVRDLNSKNIELVKDQDRDLSATTV